MMVFLTEFLYGGAFQKMLFAVILLVIGIFAIRIVLRLIKRTRLLPHIVTQQIFHHRLAALLIKNY